LKLNVVFTVTAILMVILGLAQLFTPATMAAASQMDTSPSSGFLMTVRFVGVEMLGLGLIAWFVRNTEASKARDGVTLGFTIYFALHALTSLYGQFTDTSTTLHWVAATIQGLLAIGFFVAGRNAMSKSTS
jgi:hypothetical protein